MIASFHPPTGPPGNTACYRQPSPKSTLRAYSVFAGRTPDFLPHRRPTLLDTTGLRNIQNTSHVAQTPHLGTVSTISPLHGLTVVRVVVVVVVGRTFLLVSSRSGVDKPYQDNMQKIDICPMTSANRNARPCITVAGQMLLKCAIPYLIICRGRGQPD
ncbi:hypothetical protein CKAH01_04598 [Colletotrichum kahawae]|uniref:Uncharacterized protein n=1 Tax=Colletotrichum kahawae TaxID=34407 RepID=A0AAD9YJG3_COLKA|nr:hypothetical protein CKAH01_04598 [Colletotrichum kahawae]